MNGKKLEKLFQDFKAPLDAAAASDNEDEEDGKYFISVLFHWAYISDNISKII